MVAGQARKMGRGEAVKLRGKRLKVKG